MKVKKEILNLIQECTQVLKSGCHIWQGYPVLPGRPPGLSRRYPYLYFHRSTISVRELVWINKYGQINQRKLFMKCKLKSCINPDHMYQTGQERGDRPFDMRYIETLGTETPVIKRGPYKKRSKPKNGLLSRLWKAIKGE